MAEETCRVLRGDAGEGGAKRFVQRVRCAGGEAAQRGFHFGAVRRCVSAPCACRSAARRATSENRPSSAGVVRAMAASDHCLPPADAEERYYAQAEAPALAA